MLKGVIRVKMFKKRTYFIAISALVSMLLFVQSAYAASITVWIKSNEHTAYSDFMYVTKGTTVQFYGTSSATSTHNMLLALFDPNGSVIDSVIIPPNSDSIGDTYTVTESGYYSIGIGCGGTGQTGCSGYGVLAEF